MCLCILLSTVTRNTPSTHRQILELKRVICGGSGGGGGADAEQQGTSVLQYQIGIFRLIQASR